MFGVFIAFLSEKVKIHIKKVVKGSGAVRGNYVGVENASQRRFSTSICQLVRVFKDAFVSALKMHLQ